MTRIGTGSLAWGIAVASAGLLLVDLFLDWQRTTVEVAGVVTTEVTATGWSGWGALAGVLAIGLIALGIECLRRPQTVRGHFVARGLLPLALLVATVLAAFSGETTIDVARTVGVTVESDLWPRSVGLAVGLVASLSALAAILGESAEEEQPTGTALTIR